MEISEPKIKVTDFTELNIEQKELVLRMRNHPETRKWMYNSSVITFDEHINFISSLKGKQDKIYLVVEDSGELVGSFNFTQIDSQLRSAMFGLYANPFRNVRGQGEAIINAAIDYAANKLHLKSFILEVLADNERALKFYERLGLRKVGHKENEFGSILILKKELN